MPIRVVRKSVNAYQHGDLKAAMIQAGLKLLTEGGVQGLSLRAAAQLAGVSHSAPYRHFRDKDALLFAIAEEGFRLLTRRMRDEIAPCASADARVRLRASARGYLTFAIDHPGHFRTIFGGVGCEPEEHRPPSLQEAGREAYAVLRDIIADGMGRGELRDGDPDEMSLAAWSLVHGFSMLVIDDQVGGLASDRAAALHLAGRVLQFLEVGVALDGRVGRDPADGGCR